MTEPLEEMARRGRGELEREGSTVDEEALREQRRRRRWALGAMSWLGNVQTPAGGLVLGVALALLGAGLAELSGLMEVAPGDSVSGRGTGWLLLAIACCEALGWSIALGLARWACLRGWQRERAWVGQLPFAVENYPAVLENPYLAELGIRVRFRAPPPDPTFVLEAARGTAREDLRVALSGDTLTLYHQALAGRDGTRLNADARMPRTNGKARQWASHVLVALLAPLHAQAPIEDVLFHR